jgi:chromosome segregation ATPase
MTSNADPVNQEIERLTADYNELIQAHDKKVAENDRLEIELRNQAAVIGALKTEDERLQEEDEEYGHALHAEQEAHDSNVIEIVRLQEVKRRALAIADERSKEACELRAENGRLRAALKPLASVALWRDVYPDGPDILNGQVLVEAKDVRQAREALGLDEQSTDQEG